ncbi:Hypothetical protein AA314_08141 [Archangium gephyra]|uniref:Uncharacterized protein n=1 Tax=Archangium gephyra TaxID=48 RepID=A0AAC8QG70_9BACT|nr:Hypothetical protein AA314_08141 [Archangium gephyra]
MSKVLDISEDGRKLLVLTYPALVLHDVVDGSSIPLPRIAVGNGARLLAVP